MTANFQSRHEMLDQINALKQRVAELEAAQSNSAAAHHAEVKYRSLFENASDSILMIDARSLNIIDANTNAARRLKYTLPELLRLKISDIEVTPASEDGMQEAWVSSVSGARVYECQHRCKDGTLMPVEVSSRLLHVHERDVFLHLVRDLSRRKQAEKQERQLIIERERVQLLSNFIAGASHQFKTPLAIIGSHSYLLGKTDDADQRKGQVEVINREVKNMAALIDSSILLSTLASIERLEFMPVDLVEVVREVVSSRQSDLQNKQLTVHLQPGQTQVPVPGHADYLFHALHHLVDNAIRYNHEAGEIWLRVGYHDDAAVVEIEDSGSGIQSDDLPHIFDTFYRADKSGTTRGFGLGLPIARLVVELHHGLLNVESETGRGSVFRMQVPRRQR